MSIEKTFVKEGIRESEVENYLSKRFEKAGYSHTEIQRTPLGTRILIFVHRPGFVIGTSGRKINAVTEEIKEKLGFENPLVDVREIENPFLDAQIVATRISKALERGINFKKVANYYLDQVTGAGATGVQINVGGKLMGSERSRFQKFKKGYIRHSGNYSETFVQKGYAQGKVRSGVIGVQVRIMKENPSEYEVKEFKDEDVKNKQESKS